MKSKKRAKRSLAQSVDYFRLRESVRHRGLLEPLVVGSLRNNLIGGGGTRLEILDSLYEETRDPKYSIADCVERRESNQFGSRLSHSIQNDARREMKFVERARTLVNCVRLKEKELGDKKLTQVEAVRALCENGYPISRSLYNQMVYTVEVLLPLMPRALETGVGRPQVEKIRSLFKTGAKIWEEFGEFDQKFENVFSEIVSSTDDETWRLEDLRYEVEYEISSSCDIDLQIVRLMFEVNASELEEMIKTIRRQDVQNRSSRTPSREVAAPVLPRINGKMSKTATRRTQVPTTAVNTKVATYKEFNRRKRYARKLVLQLARQTNSTKYIRPSEDNAIGYMVVGNPKPTSDLRTKLVFSYIKACYELVEGSKLDALTVPMVLSEVTDKQWSLLRDLMDVTRTLKRSLMPQPLEAHSGSQKGLAAAA